MISEPAFRVVHVFPYTARLIGGHSNAVIAYMGGQLQRGMDVRGICPRSTDVPEHQRRGIEHLPIRELDFGAHEFCELVLEEFKGCQQRVLHLHGYVGEFRKLARVARRLGIWYVVTSQGQLHYRSAFHWLKKFVFINILGSLFRNASGIHFLTQAEARRSVSLFPFWKGNRLVQPNIVEVPDPSTILPASREQLGIPADAFVFMFLGRLHVTHKGLDMLLRAFAEIVAEDNAAYLVMVGGDWEGGRKILGDLKRSLHCVGRVIFVGPQYGEDKWRMLKMADAFVSPSRWEAFGIAQVEAMRFGLPTILSDTMNLAAEVLPTHAAEVCPLRLSSLADAMKTILRSSDLRVTLSEAGRKWALENCSSAIATTRLVGLYRAVLGEAERPAGGPLNVVHVFPYSIRISGGHSNAIKAFIASQRDEGINALGVTPFPPTPQSGPDLGIPLMEVESLWRLRWEAISKGFGVHIGDTVVNFHSVNFRFAPLMRELRRLGVPYVFTSHGQLGVQTFARWLKKFTYLNFVDRGVRHAAGLQIMTSAVAKRLKYVLPGYRGEFLRQGNLVAVPKLEDIPAVTRAELGIPTDVFIVLFLGRLDVQIKGLDLVVKSMLHLPENFELVLVGPDWEGGKARLEALAGQLGCGKRVHFLGPAYGDKKWQLIRQADVFVSPSRREEFSVAVAEAMGCGVPVVTSDAVNLAEDFRTADAAILSKLDPAQIAKAILSLARDDARRKTVALKGKAWVEENCSAKKAGAKFRAYYSAVLAKQNAAN